MPHSYNSPWLAAFAKLIHQILAWNGGGNSNFTEISGQVNYVKKAEGKGENAKGDEFEGLQRFFDELK